MVDRHQRFWNLDRVAHSWLVSGQLSTYPTYEPDTLVPRVESVGVTPTMLEQARRYDRISAAIGCVPLSRSQSKAGPRCALNDGVKRIELEDCSATR